MGLQIMDEVIKLWSLLIQLNSFRCSLSKSTSSINSNNCVKISKTLDRACDSRS